MLDQLQAKEPAAKYAAWKLALGDQVLDGKELVGEIFADGVNRGSLSVFQNNLLFLFENIIT